MDKKSHRNVGPNREKNSSDASTPSSVIAEPVSRFLAGGEVAAGSQLYMSAKLREEYAARSAAIPETLSKEEQKKMRLDLKKEIRSRQNAFSKAVVRNIDKQRAADDAESLRKGEPSKYKTNHAQSTNKGVNAFGKVCKHAGKGMAVIGLANEALQICSAPEERRFKEVTRAAGRLGGGFIGGSAGAAVGALGVNPGTVVAGTLIGGTAGSLAGEKAVDVMWDLFGNK